jgi:hypothetical protein
MNLQEQISRIQSMMDVVKEDINFDDITFFKTTQGSKYVRMSDGRLRRWKSYHSNTGGEDQGLQGWSDMSIFVEPKYDKEANAVQFLMGNGYKVGLSKSKNDKMVIVVFEDGKWRVATWKDAYPNYFKIHPDKDDKPLAWDYVKEPTVGYNVVDFSFKNGNNLKDYHFGSEVSEVSDFSDEDKKLFFPSYFNMNLQEQIKKALDEYLVESDPKIGTGKKPKGSDRRLYTDENPSDTVSVKFRTKQDIVDTLNKESFKSKSHARQSQIINLIHQRLRVALERAKDPEVKKRLRTAFEYIESKKEQSKKKTQKMKEGLDDTSWDNDEGDKITLMDLLNMDLQEDELTEKWSEKYKKSINCDNPKGFSQKAHCDGKRKKSEMKEEELTEKCWKGYTQKGMKTMFGKKYPNCVKKTKHEDINRIKKLMDIDEGEVLTEKLMEIDDDVDYIYDTYFRADLDRVWANNKIAHNSFPKRTTDTSILKSPLCVKAHEINPTEIHINYGSNYYRSDQSKELISISVNSNLIDSALGFSTLDDFIRTYDTAKYDLSEEKIKGSIHHELVHWLDDSLHNRHLSKSISKYYEKNKDKNKVDVYLKTFEIQALIHNIKQMRRKYEDQWDELTFEELVKITPTLYHLYKNFTPEQKIVFTRKIKTRMSREGLLGKKMTNPLMNESYKIMGILDRMDANKK